MVWCPVLLLVISCVCAKPDPPPGHPDPHDKHPKDPLEHSIEEIYKHYQTHLCHDIDNINCSEHHIHHDEVVCGSDLQSYTHCAFAVEICKGNHLTVRHKGPCDIISLPSVEPTGVDPAFAVIKDVFCRNLNAISCGTAVSADICATDGNVYKSQCMFSKVKCFKTDLEVTDATFCGLTGQEVKTTPMPPQ